MNDPRNVSSPCGARIQLLAARARRRRQRGFTLVELIISMMAGLLISAAAFLLARNASSFFQNEARMSSAQFAVMVGMTRLKADLQRAAFMSTPNVNTDPRLCGNQAGWPAGMQNLTGISIENGGSVTRHGGDHALSVTNALSPDAIILTGLFGSTEQFATATVVDNGGGADILLQNDGAMLRTQLRAGEGGDALGDIFRVGRMLRIVDKEGRIGYSIITGMNPNVGGFVQVTTGGNPPLPTRLNTGLCGCEGFCTGAIVNPVTRMLYDLRSVNTGTYPQYAGLYQKSGHAAPAFHRGIPEAARTELIRVELDTGNLELAPTLEILAEHAVDLKFGITSVNPGVAGPAPTLIRDDIGAANVYAVGVATGTPENIRALQVRLSTRAGERDRDVPINPATSDGGLFRYNLGANAGFARMRTLVSEVQIANQQ